jgi:ABC-2 type transport system permease protein
MDGSDSNTSSIAMGYAESIVQIFSAQVQVRSRRMSAAPRVDARMRVWYNSSLRSRNYVVPGLIAVILMILAGQLTSLTIAREWEMGAMEQILSTPLRPAEMVIGKMLAYFIVGLADSVIALIVGVTVFSIPFRGSILLLAVSTCLFLCGVLFWGIYISAGARTQVEAYQLGMLSTFLPGFLMSGFVFAIDTMPKVLQVISVVVPARYFVSILKTLFLKGSGLSIIGDQMIFLALFAAMVFWLSVRKLKRQKVA